MSADPDEKYLLQAFFALILYIKDQISVSQSPQSSVISSDFSWLSYSAMIAGRGEDVPDDVRFNDSEMATKGIIRQKYRNLNKLQKNWDDFVDTDHTIEHIIENVKWGVIEDELSEIAQPPLWSEDIDSGKRERVISNTFERLSLVNFGEQFYLGELGKESLTLFLHAQVLIEEYSIEILDKNLMSEHYEGNSNTIEFLDDLPQPVREQLLQRTGILPGHVVSKMINVRGTRNDLVHQLKGTEYRYYVDEAIEDVDDLIEVLETFEERENEDEEDRFKYRR